MLSLNQIKIKLISFFQSHKQISQVVYSDEFDFAAERNLSYPVVNLEYLQSAIQDKRMIHSFKIIIGDRLEPGNSESEDEIYSDVLLIAEDFYSSMRNEMDFDIDINTSLQKFSDDKGDRVSGVVYRINLSTIRRYNACAAPLDSI